MLVEYNYNATLRERFLLKKDELKNSKTPNEETFVVYHWTADETDKIAFKGFGAVSESWVHTKFHPEPFVEGSAGYRTALLCLAVLGRRGKDYEQNGRALVKVKNGDQLLPKYLVHFYMFEDAE